MSLPELTAVVCTFNRAQHLVRAIKSLAEQSLEGDRYEIVVVDNGSCDRTAQALETCRCGCPGIPLRVVQEPVLGLSNARNRGLREARGEWIAFLDDDAVADGKWLAGILRAFTENRPAPLAVGGPILPSYEADKPPWFRDEYETRSWGSEARPLRNGESFSGSNMAFPKRVLEETGGFHPALGARGGHLSVGEETDVFEAIWSSGAAQGRLLYDPTLVVYHAVPAHKMRLSYGLKRAFAAGQSWSARHPPGGAAVHAATFLRLGARLGFFTTRAAWRFRGGRPWKAWCLEEIGPAMETLGRLAGYASLFVSLRQDVSGREVES